MTQLICNFRYEDPDDESILVINCSLDKLGFINVKKGISGSLSEHGKRTLFNGCPINSEIKLTWESTEQSDKLVNLLGCKIEKGLTFSRIPPTMDNSWDYVIVKII